MTALLYSAWEDTCHPPFVFYGDNFVGSAALAEVCALMSAILGLNRDSDLYKKKCFFLLESYPSPPVTSQHFVDIFFSYRQKWYNCNVKNSFEVPGSVSRSGSTLKPTLFASHKSHPSTKKIVEIRRQHFELSCWEVNKGNAKNITYARYLSE